MKHTDKHRRGVNNIPDYKNEDGFWSKGFTETTDTEYIYYHTRAGKLWNSINNRCAGRQEFLDRNPCYKSVKNNFTDFQSFVDWCHTQKGYFEKDAYGMFWQIDKDILQPASGFYSEETCCFVPGYINSVLLTKRREAKNLPIGVKLCPRTGKWISRIKDKHLGLFATIEEASAAWAREKVLVIQQAISLYSEHPAHREDVVVSLISRVDYLNTCSETFVPVYVLR